MKHVYRAQKESPTRGDFVKLFENDIQLIEMDFNENAITAENKKSFKKHVKNKMCQVLFKFLKELQSKYSKIKHILYPQFKIQPYMVSPQFTTKMVGTLFNLRSSMTKGFQSNFSHMFNNKSTCPLKNCTSRD